jgi:hypothetical protein
MTRCAGSGAYGSAPSLSMALRESGAAAAELPEAGFIECLTLMPFGTLCTTPTAILEAIADLARRA